MKAAAQGAERAKRAAGQPKCRKRTEEAHPGERSRVEIPGRIEGGVQIREIVVDAVANDAQDGNGRPGAMQASEQREALHVDRVTPAMLGERTFFGGAGDDMVDRERSDPAQRSGHGALNRRAQVRIRRQRHAVGVLDRRVQEHVAGTEARVERTA